MACHLFGPEPLPEPMMVYCQLDSWEQISVEFSDCRTSKNDLFHCRAKKRITHLVSFLFFSTVKDNTCWVNWEELIHKTVPPAPMALLSVLWLFGPIMHRDNSATATLQWSMVIIPWCWTLAQEGQNLLTHLFTIEIPSLTFWDFFIASQFGLQWNNLKLLVRKFLL